MTHPLMLPGFAGRVFDVLAEKCGAEERDRKAFVTEFETRSDGPTNEWRCHGNFSFKFRFPRFTVDPTDEMTEKLKIIKLDTDAQLAKIKEEMIAQGWDSCGGV